MDSRPTTAESKHHYQPAPLNNHSVRNNTTPRSATVSLAEASPANFPASHLDVLSSLYQVQLLQYNKLVSPGRGGGGLQIQPASALLPAAPSIQPAPKSRSRSASKVSLKDNHQKQPGTPSGHGNKPTRISEKPDRAVITTGKEAMASKAPAQRQADLSHPLASRPAQRSATHPVNHHPPTHASSVPSTPQQHARNFSLSNESSREPSPNAAQNHSPRSAYSETNGTLPSLRPLPPRLGGCIYETALIRGRRRMPYSMGSDRLEKIDDGMIKNKLSEEEGRQLSADMTRLYERLLPTPDIEKKRMKLVTKLETIFNEAWPGHDIRVHLFGSSENKLCSDDSDVDICITTEWKELEGVCIIAELLAKRGMQKVVCVSSAKVPIVKIWDPELNLSCDMNVNNTLALENTRMVRTYMQIDERARQLAMIIKYWTRRRIVNDAAFGGTLSSYTWICMIIMFLQLRDPPVLPALHQRPHQKMPLINGHQSEFADDLSKLRGFGARNKESLGDLLFHFFKFYAHELDYDKWALSIRLGKLVTKTDKKWHLAINNMLCVEEPFNIARNLGNTADDTSFRGLHIELRRAFDLISEGRLDECLEQYEFPKEDETTKETVFQKPIPRPVLLRSSSQQQSGKGGRGGNFRGNRHFSRNGNNNRRASSSTAYENNPIFVQTGLPATTLAPQEAQWYQAQQPQFAIQPADVYGTLNALQMQEHSLRIQLYTQTQFNAQQQALAHAQRMQGGQSQSTPTDRSRTNSFDQPPLTAPLRPEMYIYGFPLQPAPFFPAGFTTYPSSPSTSSAVPEFRRSHRSTATDSGTSSSSGTLRSQSQPASRSTSIPGQAIPGYPGVAPAPNGLPPVPPRQVNGVPIPSFISDEGAEAGNDKGPRKATTESPPEEDSRYLGYYSHGTTSPVRTLSAIPNGIPAFGDLAQNSQGRRRLSTDQLPQSILDRRMRRTSRSPSPLGHARAFSMGTNSAPLAANPFPPATSNVPRDNRPLVVNGSSFTPSSTAASSRHTSAAESKASDEPGYDNPLHISQGLGSNGLVAEPLSIQTTMSPPEQSPPVADRPLVVNGSNQSPAAVTNPPDIQSFGQRIAAMSAMNTVNSYGSVPYTAVPTEGINGKSRLPESSRQRILARQQPNGIAPLDLAIADPNFVYDLQHLSPVYETRTPSPTVMRKFDTSTIQEQSAPVVAHGSNPVSVSKEHRSGSTKTSQRSPPETPTGKKTDVSSALPNPRVNGIVLENGHVRAAKSESDNPAGWQRSKSRKKQGDPKTATQGHPQSEQLPKNEAERKGG